MKNFAGHEKAPERQFLTLRSGASILLYSKAIQLKSLWHNPFSQAVNLPIPALLRFYSKSLK